MQVRTIKVEQKSFSRNARVSRVRDDFPWYYRGRGYSVKASTRDDIKTNKLWTEGLDLHWR